MVKGRRMSQLALYKVIDSFADVFFVAVDFIDENVLIFLSFFRFGK